MVTRVDQIRVFLSSRMAGLKDLRATLKRSLERQGLDVFVYEVDAGARPDDPESASLTEVERADIVVLVLEHSYGEITEREYDHARKHDKPCLVYTRLDGPVDPNQRRFLDKLSGARGAPSRERFTDAPELADKVARDTQSWLVREFRRLSAAVIDPASPPRQAAQFHVLMERLQTASSMGLQTGSAADLLAWQLRLWFDALGYPLDGETSANGAYVDFLVRLPERRRQFRTVLVRAKDSEVRAPDVEEAVQLLEHKRAELRLDECWLVGPRRVSPAAREAARPGRHVDVFTLDEIIEEDVDFTPYFEWLDAEARRTKIDESYVPLAATVTEFAADGKSAGKSRYTDVGVYVDRWLDDPSGEHVSLLGEFGTGKSWFSLEYAVGLSRKYRAAQSAGATRPRIPLLVRLRDYSRGFKDVASLLTDVVFREHQINIPTYSALEVLNRLGRLLFIFDGFDEMAARVDRQKMTDNFWAMAAVLSPGAKAILTCRTEYFQFAQQARDILEGRLRGSKMRDVADTSRFQVAELEMFDDARLRKVLAKKASPSQVDAVMANKNLVDLARRPVMVDLLIEAMPSLDADRADMAQVYYQAVKLKMERDIRQSRTFTSMVDKMFFMCELSWEMLSTDQMKFHYKAIPERIRAYFGGRVQNAEEDHWHHDLLSQTMLVRDDEGHYRPAHRSLLEFFVAYKLSAELGAIRNAYLDIVRARASVDPGLPPARYRWSTYFAAESSSKHPKPVLSEFTRDFEARLGASWGRAKIDGALSGLIFLLCGKERLHDALRASGEDAPASAHYVARLLSLLAQHGPIGAVSLPGAIVNDVRLVRQDLTSASLARSVWTNGSLERVRFDDACLAESRFQNMRLTDVTFRSADLTSCEVDERSTIGATIQAAAWCRIGERELVIASSTDGRFVAIEPSAEYAIEFAPPFDPRSWEALIEGSVAVAGIGVLEFGPKAVVAASPSGSPRWRPTVLPAEMTMLSNSSTHGSIHSRPVIVSMQASQDLVASDEYVDASHQGGPDEGFLAVAPSGRMLAGLSIWGTDSAFLTRGRRKRMLLKDCVVSYGITASFSPSDSLIALCESPRTVGFWRTDTGELVATFRMPPLCVGARIDDAKGIGGGTALRIDRARRVSADGAPG